MSRTEITQAQWRAVSKLPKIRFDLPPEPSRFRGDELPVESITWYEAIEFCARLFVLTGKSYSLPSEAEWEYACRAGSTTPFYFGETLTTALANYDGKSTTALAQKGEYRQKTVAPGSLGMANAFGLFDLHGNVAEWCLDDWHDDYNQAPTDDSPWGLLGTYCVVRGGSWFNQGALLVAHHRDRYLKQAKSNSVGFRIVVKLDQ